MSVLKWNRYWGKAVKPIRAYDKMYIKHYKINRPVKNFPSTNLYENLFQILPQDWKCNNVNNELYRNTVPYKVIHNHKMW